MLDNHAFTVWSLFLTPMWWSLSCRFYVFSPFLPLPVAISQFLCALFMCCALDWQTLYQNNGSFTQYFYFEIGLKYKHICLDRRHGHQIRERHLKKVLRTRGQAQKDYSELAVVVEYIRNELLFSGQLHGYWWMYGKCRKNGLYVTK